MNQQASTPNNLASFSVFLTKTANKAQRKLDKPLRLKIRDAIQRLQTCPEDLGERLTSPLTGIYSHHIKYKGKEFRIAYKIDPDAECLIIVLIGPHENFYRKLQKLLYAS